jgi:hypothetical protein
VAPAGRAPMLAPFAACAKSAARSARARSQRVAVRRAVAFRSWAHRDLGRTRYVILAKVAYKETQTVVSALIKQAKMLPNELYVSLTWDGARNLRVIDDLR